jgi:hypothetical protein
MTPLMVEARCATVIGQVPPNATIDAFVIIGHITLSDGTTGIIHGREASAAECMALLMRTVRSIAIESGVTPETCREAVLAGLGDEMFSNSDNYDV